MQPAAQSRLVLQPGQPPGLAVARQTVPVLLSGQHPAGHRASGGGLAARRRPVRQPPRQWPA